MEAGAVTAIRVRLLGTFSFMVGGTPVRLESVKTEALLAFLALEPGPHPRTKLAGLLWPEIAEERAARNLRHALWDLRRAFAAAAPDAIAGSRTDIALVPGDRVLVDAMTVMTAGRRTGVTQDEIRRELEGAAELYRGELLDGVLLADTEEFESWLVVQRERLRTQACEVLRRLVQIHRQRGDANAALAHARRLVALDPWREEAHRAVMELLALLGEPAAALAQFESCRQVLAEQLQTVPTAETVNLAERIRGLPGAADAPTPLLPLLRHNLPVASTPFVGREEELEAIARLLGKPECRALCLLGPGGIGKTRVALQVAQRIVLGGESGAAAFPGGVWFVPPREAPGDGVLLAAIAEAVGMPVARPESGGDLTASLFAYLRQRRLLLLIDGFEHVLGETGAVSVLLAAAPEVKLLLTTRERPRLDGEWVFEVRGLPLPVGVRGGRTGAATRLFVETARRVRFGFEASDEDIVHIAEICRAVDGSPLAIELAAGWVRSLPVAEINRGLAGSPGFLASAEDQRLRAVLESSWERLDEEGRQRLATMSVFVSGCTREAAEAVAQASPANLRALVDRSFVRLEASGRFTIHEVLRRFAAERLAETPARLHEARLRLADYFADLCAARESLLWGPSQGEVLDDIAREMENLCEAWHWAAREGRHEVLEKCLECLTAFAHLRGWAPRGEALLREAIEAVRVSKVALQGRLLIARGGLRNRLGRYAAARQDLEQALELAPVASSQGLRARALFHLGEAALLEGRFVMSRELLERALGLAADSRLRAEIHGRLGRAALETGRHAEAEISFAQALKLARAAGDLAGMVWATNQLGYAAYFRGAPAEATDRFTAALQLAKESGNRAGTKDALTGLAYFDEDLGEFATARRRYEEVLEICADLGDRRGEAYAWMVIGETYRRPGQAAQARHAYAKARSIAVEIGADFILGQLAGNLAYLAAATGELDEAAHHVRETLANYRVTNSAAVALPALVAMAEVYHARGETSRALALLGLVRAHPANRQDHAVEAERVLAMIRASVPPREVEAGLVAGGGLDLDAIAADLANPSAS
ncbi:MAG: ATP-binding protein [Thermoanaerobaculales bacterium]